MSVADVDRGPVPRGRSGAEPLLKLRGVKKHFPITRGILIQRKVGQVHAVDGIDLEIHPGETVGLVGETGCGKSTTARLIARLLDVTEGTVEYDGREITRLSRRRMRPLRREIAMIFQDPYASLNPRKTVGSVIGEPFQIHGVPGRDRPRSPWTSRPARLLPFALVAAAFVIALVAGVSAGIEVPLSLPFGLLGLAVVVEVARRILRGPGRRRWNKEVKGEVQRLMELVGLNPEHYNRFPHEFSGGQRQRIGVARALALRPRLIVCDEPVSALDVSIQAQILNLLEDLQEEFNLTYIFIAHDLSVVKHMSDRVAVMYLGRIVEIAPGDTLYRNPKHPYTGALLSAVPIPDPDLAARRRRIILEGDVPSPIDPPSGCRFHPRCPRAQFPVCKEDDPELLAHHEGQLAACHFPLEDRAVIESTA
jgi:peptide/nickel transport system ATP-binding protein